MSFLHPHGRTASFSHSTVLTLMLWVGAIAYPFTAQSATPRPDYFVSSSVDPYFATGPITILYSASNLSDAKAPATTIKFWVTPDNDPSQRSTLGQVDVPALGPWQNIQGTVTFTLPSWLPPGLTWMRLYSNINPKRRPRESNTANNITSAGFGAQIGLPPPPPPPGSSGTFLSDFAVHAVPALPRPALRTPLVDPIFGTTVTRLTDPSMDPADASGPVLGLRHEYSRYPALSADNAKVVVTVLGGTYRGAFEIRNVATGSLLHRLTPLGDPEFSWHPTDPTRLFYRFGNEIRIFHADSGQSETLMTFPQYYFISTREEGRPTDDWHYYAFLGYHDATFSSADLVVVDLVARQVIATLSNFGIPGSVSMSPLGTYVVVEGAPTGGTRVYDRNTLAYLRTLPSEGSHSDFALDTNGDEVLVYHAVSGAQLSGLAAPNPPSGSPLASVRLRDGKTTLLLGDTNWGQTIAGTFMGWDWGTPHFSGLASRIHPGWVLVSAYSGVDTAQRPFSREVFWLKLDGSGQVRRIAHHHSDQGFRLAPWGGMEKDYWAEPQATSSWDGNLVLFCSVWGEPFNHYDLYSVTGQWW